MVVQQGRELIVPTERFDAAKTYEQYVASISSNQEKFADNLAKASVPDELAARLRAVVARPGGPTKLMVIGEDWCPDVYRGLPVAKRIADAAGMELRMVERDQHLDLMEPFKSGDFLSIPVYVFMSDDGRVLATWVERPARANAEMREAMSPVFGPSGTRQLTEKLGREPTAEEKETAKIEAQQRYDAFQAASPYWAGWRDAAVVEVVELLESATA